MEGSGRRATQGKEITKGKGPEVRRTAGALGGHVQVDRVE